MSFDSIPVRKTAFILTFAVVLCLAACSRLDKPAAPPEKVTLALATPPYTVLADIALAKEYFRKAGIEVTPHFHSTGKAALDEMLAGKADFATVAETPFMFAVMNGHKISIVATIQSSHKAAAILARSDMGIKIPEDLAGKRIGASLGTISEYYLDSFLTTYGISLKDVKVVNLKPEEIQAALAGGKIDAAAAFQPFLNSAQQKLGDSGITFTEKEIYTQTFNLVASQEYIRNNPARVKQILSSLIEAAGFADSAPAEAIKIVADFRQVEPSMLRAIWEDHMFSVHLDQSLILALEDETTWAIGKGLTDEKKVPNYLNFIYSDSLRTVKSSAVRILR